mgnify:CR=1 FL=1
MYYTTKGLVLREVQYKDNDKLLSLLTDELGLITAKARGVKRKNSPLRGGCQLLCYGEFTLYERGGYYIVTEAEPLRLFDGIRQDIELLSLGSYFAQLMETVSMAGQSDPEVLSLGLNSLYALDVLKKPQAMVKAVFELRLMCLIGFTPMLDGCGSCGDPEARYFLFQEGTLICDICRKAGSSGEGMTISPGVLAAMRHVSGCEKRRLFSFKLAEAALRSMGEVTERFLLTQLGQGFSSLDFYKRLFTISMGDLT